MVLPLPRCKWIKAFASKLCPVRSIQPHPESLVHPFSAPQFHGLVLTVVGLLGISFASCGRSAKRVSRIGIKFERYVSHSREVKSA